MLGSTSIVTRPPRGAACPLPTSPPRLRAARSSAAERKAAKAATDIVVAEVARGAGRIESYAALYAKGEPSGGYIVGRLAADERRFLAVMEPGSVAARALLFAPEPIGQAVMVRHAEAIDYFDVA